MRLFRPVKQNYITQLFGENKLSIYKELGMEGHNGIDFLCPIGEPVYHSADWPGIAKTEVDNYGGIGVDVISLEKQDNERHYKLRYWHLSKVSVYDGQKISSGQLIGYSGNTGYSTGAHLHWGLKPCEKDGTPLNKYNGFFGAVDPMPYYEDITVREWIDVRNKAVSVIQLAKRVIFEVIQYLKGRSQTL